MRKLKVLLVSSRLTYMPENYFELYKNLLGLRADFISGFVLLDNLDKKSFIQSLGLYFLGAKNISKQLIRNMIDLPFKKREKLFEKYKIPTMTWDSMNSKEAIDYVKDNDIDVIVNLRTRCIYKSEILKAPKIGCINIHHGLLPDYRGTLCDLYALTQDRPAGFSIHEMVEKIDAGLLHRVIPVATKDQIKINNKYSYLNYLEKTCPIEAVELGSFLEQVAIEGRFPNGTPNKAKQKVFTKNPTRKQISKFIKEGFEL